MYSTCTFCNKPLGTNEVFEIFPVGRRIAFDSARGRLWVVCRSCERWNLSPLEERWEIVEECERAFSSTRIRTSTEQIGLARLREGLELVRIGAPMRPEFAAWRYGDQFGRRRRNAYIKAGVVLGAFGSVFVGLSVAGVGVAGFASLGVNGAQRMINGSPDKVVAAIPHKREIIQLKRKDLKTVALTPRGDSWGVTVLTRRGSHLVTLEGDEAAHALGLVLPALNRFAGKKADVNEAVNLLEESSPVKFVEQVARRNFSIAKPKKSIFDAGMPQGAAEPDPATLRSLQMMPYATRLALEMATHEEAERRALEGELAILEEAWRQAEEIAEISDNLLLPDSLTDKLRGMR